ncbi:hypothetical protein HXX76_004588 [Chlamydomonas incerta]|uniref:CobB/CobQ-like glutamine amidotransferase domain-containing protein n=1 Tax=Chlamydomonas incerta TaxID=51695 RepID=A0A835W848_CHLIN|nr:hypothetical protein HXX76_004588 [Chlamydomonas incerta]|eukprot:KAG2439226.1 hypothetical protein HXX76_004588 [Chlamydomonas incerta]
MTRALFIAASQAGVEGWIVSLAAAGAPVKHVSAWAGPGELGRRYPSAVNSDPFLLGPGVSLEAQLSQQLGSSGAGSDALLVVSVDPATQPLLPRAGVVLLVWQPQVPSQVLDQVQQALAAAPSLLADGAAAVRGVLLVDASPSITLSVTHKVLEGAGLAALARKPTVLASRASASPQASLQALQQLAEPLPPPPAPQPALPASAGGVVRIAVARDDAFGPAFHENLTLLSQAGAQLLFFSPLYDTTLPAGATCLYLSSCGALEPERWQQLAANRPLLAAVRAFADVGGMVLAEGGGLLYLSRTVELQEDDGGHHHRVHEMAGVLPFKTRLLPEPQSAAVQLSVLPGNPLLPPGARPRGYLFAEASLVLVEERQLQGLGLGGLGVTPGKGGAGGSHFATTYEAVVVSAGKGGELEETAPAAEGYTVQNVLGSACLLYLPSEPGLAAHMLRRCACVDPAALAAGMATHLGCSMSAVSSSKMQLHAAALASKDGSRAGSRRQSIQDVSAWGATFSSGTGGDRSNASTASGMAGLLAHGHGHYPPHVHSHQHHASLPMQPLAGAGPTAISGATSPRLGGTPPLPHSSSSTSLSGAGWVPPGARRSLCGPLALQGGLQHVQSQPEAGVAAAAAAAAQAGGAWRPSHEGPYSAGPSNLARQQMLLQQQIASVTPAGSVASMSPSSASPAPTSAFVVQPRAETPEPQVVAAASTSAMMDLDVPHPPASACADGGSGLSCGLGSACGRCRSEQLPTVLERSGSFGGHPAPLVGMFADGSACGAGAVIHHAASAGSLATAYASTSGYGGVEMSAQSYGRGAGLDDWSGSGVSVSGWPMHSHRHGSMPVLASLANAGGAPPHAHSSGVVCCAPGATEALVAMGLGNRLAGIGSDCDHPPDVCASRRVVLAWVAPEEAPQGAAARGIRVIQPAAVAAAAAAAQGNGGGGFLAAAAGGRAGRPSVDKSGPGARGGCGRVLLVDELSLRQEPPGVLVLPDPCDLSDSERLQLEQALVETGLLQPGGAPGGACAVLHASCRSLVDVMDLMLELGAAAGEPDKASMLLERLQARMRRVAAAVAAATLAGGGGSGGVGAGVAGQAGLGRLPGGVASSAALAAAAAAAAVSPAAGAMPAFLPGGRPRRVLVLQSLMPMVEPGRWVPEMLATAGASSCLALPGGDDVALSWQDVRERAAPDVIIILTSPGDGAGVGGCCVVPSHHAPGAGPHAGGAGAPHSHASCAGGAGGAGGGLREQLAALAAQPGWWCLPAVRSSQVYLMQAAYCVRAGPRVVDGVELLARLLLPPGCFTSSRKVPAGAVMKLSLAPGQRCRATLLPTYFVAYN